MPKYNVEVCRTAYGFHTITVTADTPEQAARLAENIASDFEFSTKSADYTTDVSLVSIRAHTNWASNAAQ